MRKHVIVFAASFVFAAVLFAQAPGVSKGKSAPKAAEPVFAPASSLKWGDLDPAGAPGVKIADVWGDHTKGGFGAFVKFPAGFATPLHTHTATLKLVIISGTFIQTPEGKPEVRLGPGSFERQPAGNYRHVSACDKASECLFYVEGAGKFDLIPVKK